MLICSDEFKSSMFKKHQCYFDVKKHECMEIDLSRMDNFMSMLERSTQKARQKVLLTFAEDYKEDKRELIFIPEVVNYIMAFAKKYPYFWYYVMPNDSIYLPQVFLQKKRVNINSATEKYALNVDSDNLLNFTRVLAYNLQMYGESIRDIEGSAKSCKAWVDSIMQALGIGEPTGGVTVKL